MSAIPKSFWDEYAGRIGPAAAEALKQRTDTSESTYLTIELLEQYLAVPGGLARELLDDLVDVRSFVSFQEAQDSLFVRREPFVRK